MNSRRLHIGALKASPGWETLNSQPLEGINHVCNARDLSAFADNTFDSLYASHVLEHFDYRDEVAIVLVEWCRVISPGGQLFVSVPDLDTIFRLYGDRERFDVSDRFMMMRMIMGGHSDQYDYHHVAFNQEFLTQYLTKAGFDTIQRIAEFSLFNDTSGMRFKGELISLNLIAEKPNLIKQASSHARNTFSDSSQSMAFHNAVNLVPESQGAINADGRFIAISTEKAINLFEAGYTAQAIELCRDILSTFPDNDEIMLIMAKMYRNVGRIDETLPLLHSIPQKSFFYADALFTLGMVLMNRGDFTGGADCFTRLVELDTRHIDGHNNLGLCLMELGRPEEAQRWLFHSIQMSPDYAKSHLYLGNLFARYWRLGEAREQFQRVIELQPDNAGAYNNLSGIAVLEGNIAEALALLRTVLKLQPNSRIAADNLLLNLNYSDSYTPEQIRDEHLRLAAFYNGPVQEPTPCQHEPGRKIRIGYVSGDFRSHSVAFFFEPVLHCHNRSHFEIFCYDMVTVPDETTGRMRALGWAWRTIYGLSDTDVTDQIRSDGIDILVDLAGHTLGNRLGVFAMKPAPIQVTWLGYPNTTGMKQMDFRLTDEWADPTGVTDHLYSESLVRLPESFLCYSPPPSAPEIATLPGEPFTFCCFNNYPKISDTVIRLWARILRAVPGSRLLLKNGPLGDLHVRNRLAGRFAEVGIEPSRLILECFAIRREEHLQQYGSCHVALDTFPYNGTTTSCEALWMGVPVVTLAGTTHASRVGVSILENIGASELIAQNAEQYVDIAVDLSKHLSRLKIYRQCLREQLSRSPLMDAATFTADLEQAYQRMLD